MKPLFFNYPAEQSTYTIDDEWLLGDSLLAAQILSDQASRDSTLAQITYTEIRAPVSGRIGSIPNKTGTIVRIADNTVTSGLATINQVDPIYVQFAIPQIALPDLPAAMAQGGFKVNAMDDGVKATIGIADGKLYLRTYSALYCFGNRK